MAGESIYRCAIRINASWLLTLSASNGKEHYFGLGPLWRVSLKTARERARAAKGPKLFFDGVDPVQAKRNARAAEAVAAAKAMTFEAAALAYFNDQEEKLAQRQAPGSVLGLDAALCVPVDWCAAGRHD